MTATALDAKSGVSVVAELAAAVGPDNVLHRAEDLLLYEYDGSVARRRPDAVVFPASTQEVVEVVNIARARRIPVVARGAGTGLAGGCIPLKGGIVLSTARMNRIISIDYRNMIAVVEPGVVNLDLTAEVAPRGFQYVPDPSSEKASTIGGNVATNAGGLTRSPTVLPQITCWDWKSSPPTERWSPAAPPPSTLPATTCAA